MELPRETVLWWRCSLPFPCFVGIPVTLVESRSLYSLGMPQRRVCQEFFLVFGSSHIFIKCGLSWNSLIWYCFHLVKGFSKIIIYSGCQRLCDAEKSPSEEKPRCCSTEVYVLSETGRPGCICSEICRTSQRQWPFSPGDAELSHRLNAKSEDQCGS